ncbi:glycosyl transferase [Spirochaetia bacterium]|nr:glycosyl transferase [Spirochaetia bacterium]
MPELAQKCIASWKTFFPGYEIKEWNESNYDVHKIPYISEAYDAKKFAFVSDYTRFDVLYQYGGIYFDTDVEVIRAFDDVLAKGAFMGLESIGNVAAGLGMGCNAGLGIIAEILEFYNNLHENTKTVVGYVTDILRKHGFKDENKIQTIAGIVIYPIEYFCPKEYGTGVCTISPVTHSIHHYAASWVPYHIDKYRILGQKIIAKHGDNFVTKFIYYSLQLVIRIKQYGIKYTFEYYHKRLCKKST